MRVERRTLTDSLERVMVSPHDLLLPETARVIPQLRQLRACFLLWGNNLSICFRMQKLCEQFRWRIRRLGAYRARRDVKRRVRITESIL